MSEKQQTVFEHKIETLIAGSEKLERRMEKIEEVNEAVWKISSSVELMAQQIKEMNIRYNDHIQRLYEKIEKQGEINAKTIEAQSKRIDDLERKPAKRWEAVSAQVLAILTAAIIGFILASVGLGG